VRERAKMQDDEKEKYRKETREHDPGKRQMGDAAAEIDRVSAQ
jgi:hypothetical protein